MENVGDLDKTINLYGVVGRGSQKVQERMRSKEVNAVMTDNPDNPVQQV